MLKSVVIGFSLLFLASTGSDGWAARGPDRVDRNDWAPGFQGMVLRRDGIYRFDADVELLPKAEYQDGVYVITPERLTVGFTAGEPVAVRFVASGDAVIAIVPSLEERALGDMPDRIVLSSDEFDRSGLRFVAEGDAAELIENFMYYEVYREASRGGSRARRGAGRAHYRNSAGGSYYGCVASVCQAIGGCSGRVGNGVGMTSYLRRARGWRSVNCSRPPVGAVASWSGGPHGLGHTARWNGRGWCYDRGCADPGRGYHLKDCVASP